MSQKTKASGGNSQSKLAIRRLFTDYSYLVSFVLILIIAWAVN